jgi:hypothetical protein
MILACAADLHWPGRVHAITLVGMATVRTGFMFKHPASRVISGSSAFPIVQPQNNQINNSQSSRRPT